jgi:hypothetical protein
VIVRLRQLCAISAHWVSRCRAGERTCVGVGAFVVATRTSDCAGSTISQRGTWSTFDGQANPAVGREQESLEPARGATDEPIAPCGPIVKGQVGGKSCGIGFHGWLKMRSPTCSFEPSQGYGPVVDLRACPSTLLQPAGPGVPSAGWAPSVQSELPAGPAGKPALSDPNQCSHG